MKIDIHIMGPIETNSYFLYEKDEVILIDPAGKSEKVIDFIGNYKPVAVLLTHGHFDHIKAVDDLYDKYKLPVYLNKEDEKLARDKYQGKDFNIFNYITCPIVDAKEGNYKIGNFNFDIIQTPGHTEGSVLYRFNKDIFTGDTLFKESVGRTDLEGGNNHKLMSSLKVFKNFDIYSIIYPGHGPSSTLEYELIYNQFLNNI